MRRPGSGTRSNVRRIGGAWVLTCAAACLALVLWLSVAPAGQPLSLAMRDDPSDLRPRKRFQPDGEVTAADARGGARTAIPLGPAVQAAAEAQRVQNGVVQEAGRIEKVIAAGDSGDSTLGGGDIEAVTRRKIPFPDDADTSTAGIAGGRRRQPELQEEVVPELDDARGDDDGAEEDDSDSDTDADDAEEDPVDTNGDPGDAEDEAGEDAGDAEEETGDAEEDAGDAEEEAEDDEETVDVEEVDFHEEDPGDIIEGQISDLARVDAADDAAGDGDADSGDGAAVDEDVDTGSDDDDGGAEQGDSDLGDGDDDSVAPGGASAEDAALAPGEEPPLLLRKIPFVNPVEPGAMRYGDMDWCPGAPEPAEDAVTPVDAALRVLVVTGAQEGGTQLLQQVLGGHPAAIVGTPRHTHPQVASSDDLGAGDLNFFNQWPAGGREAYLGMWPQSEVTAAAAGDDGGRFLLDVSADYLMNAVVPPRLKQLVPQAKVVVVLQDPTEAAYYYWSALADSVAFCGEVPANGPCVMSTFEETFNQYRDLFHSRFCDFSKSGTMYGPPMTWGRCNRCSFSFFDHLECLQLPTLHQELFPCIRRQLGIFDSCVWAPQLSWWLHFYRPEDLFLTTTAALADPDKRMQILHSIIEFAGLPDADPVDPIEVQAAGAAAEASSSTILASIEPEVIQNATLHFAPQMQDLQAVLDTYFPDADLPGLFR